MTCPFFAECEISSKGLRTCKCVDMECSDVPDEETSVCGSDGEIYLNACTLMKHSCANAIDITMEPMESCMEEGSGDDYSGDYGSGMDCNCKFGGECNYGDPDMTTDDEMMMCTCLSIYCEKGNEMLCGDNGVTYTSMCELNKAECEIQKEITVVKK